MVLLDSNRRGEPKQSISRLAQAPDSFTACAPTVYMAMKRTHSRPESLAGSHTDASNAELHARLRSTADRTMRHVLQSP